MVVPRVTEWRKLPLSLAELCIDTTLRCGQSFRWRKINDEWRCALHGRILSLKQDDSHLHFRATWPASSIAPVTTPDALKKETPSQETSKDDGTEALLRRYFALHLDLTSLYERWSRADANFRKRAPKFTGVRILGQDAWEALICFICSSNNNIARISQMVHKLCTNYGPLIGHIDGEPFHDFPTPDALTGPAVESHLRQLGFGYRAKYIADTARTVAAKPPGWLDSLRKPTSTRWSGVAESSATFKEAQEALVSLSGVGPKVADCVCLMGLGWGEAVPVDTHVWQIAQRDYRFGKGGKTFNKALYDAVGDHFRGLWGEYAGWAHSVLFTADLRAFSEQAKVEKTVKVKREGKVIKEERQVKVEEADALVPRPRARKRKATQEVTEDVEVKQEGAEAMEVVTTVRRSKRTRTGQ